MGPTDDDIHFDFFEDEPATTEVQQQPTKSRLPRRGGSGPRRPSVPHRSLAPLLRLGALVVGLVVLLVVFGLLLQSCASTSKHDTYAHYMDKVSVIAKSSADNGAAVTNALVTPGIKASELSQKLSGIAEQERQNVAAAQDLDPPGTLRDENGHMIESLQLRVSGTQGLANAFAKTTAATKPSEEASILSAQGNRLIASDVVWEDLFRVPSLAELKEQGVVGVPVPPSKFVTDPDLLGTSSMAALLNRINSSGSGSTPTGLHGTNIVQTKALPSGLVLSQTAQNTINGVSTNLAFAVTIEDSGNFQEAGIKVTLTIQQKNPIVKTQTIDLINPQQQKTLTFSNLGEVTFAIPAHVNVDVKPVPGETRVDNNRASYPVIFSLG